MVIDTCDPAEGRVLRQDNVGTDARPLPTFLLERLAAANHAVVFIGEAMREIAESVSFCDADAGAAATCQCRYATSVHAAVESRAACGEEPARVGEAAVMSLADTVIHDEKSSLVLGEACRHFATRLLVELRHENDDPEVAMQAATRLFAFGFRRLGRFDTSGQHRTWYEYSLRDYKPAPDWLNARFWANPERFHHHED